MEVEQDISKIWNEIDSLKEGLHNLQERVSLQERDMTYVKQFNLEIKTALTGIKNEIHSLTLLLTKQVSSVNNKITENKAQLALWIAGLISVGTAIGRLIP